MTTKKPVANKNLKVRTYSENIREQIVAASINGTDQDKLHINASINMLKARVPAISDFCDEILKASFDKQVYNKSTSFE